jgi:homogentisate 1,2-dioxygenase
LLYVESFTPIFTPSRYRNEFGQILEHSPFCERDIVRPSNLKTYDEQGEFDIFIKKKGMMFPYQYANHPFDVAGWDGYHYPYIFQYLILNQLLVAFICHHQFIKHLKMQIL